MWTSRLALVTTALLAGFLAESTSAQAAGSGPTEAVFGFAPATPAVATTLNVSIAFHSPAGPEAKPPASTLDRLELPLGSRFNNDAVPVCAATDIQIELLGRAACPAGSKVAEGWATVRTGLPGSADRLAADLVGYNTANGAAMVAFVPNSPIVFAVDRATTNGNVYVAHPPLIPGGPPDLHTVVNSINLVFPANTGFVTTPDSCPGDRTWRYRAEFEFADGTTQDADGAIPCTG